MVEHGVEFSVIVWPNMKLLSVHLAKSELFM